MSSQYEILLKIIEHGSLTKASEELNYTQSGISHTLNTLEKKFGFKLLTRNKSGISLTSEGQQLLPYIQSVQNSENMLKEKIKEMHELESGLLRIGTFTSISYQWLPNIIKLFKSEHPKVQFELLHGNNEECEKWLLQDRIDCSFVILPLFNDIETIFLHRDPMVVVMSKEHPNANEKSFPIDLLDKFPYIEIDDCADNEASRIFNYYHIKPNVQLKGNDDYAVISMIEKDLGISLMPELVLKDVSKEIIWRELEKPSYRDIGIAYKNKNSISNLTKEFLHFTKNWVEMEYS